MSRAVRAGALGAAIVGVYAVVLRSRQLVWGATTEEAGSTLAGDDLVPNADLVATRCIDESLLGYGRDVAPAGDVLRQHSRGMSHLCTCSPAQIRAAAASRSETRLLPTLRPV